MYTRLLKRLLLLSLCLTSGCGILVTDHFSRNTGPSPEKGYLLRGSGWTDPKYAYVLDDVGQIETRELIAAVQIENYYQSLLGFGFLVPVIPTFGLVKEGYRGKISATEEGVKVKVGMFSKAGPLRLNPCDFVLESRERSATPVRFNTTFLGSTSAHTCIGKAAASGVDLPGRANGLFRLELFYAEPVFPGGDLQVRLPGIEAEAGTLPTLRFDFGKGSETWGNTIL